MLESYNRFGRISNTDLEMVEEEIKYESLSIRWTTRSIGDRELMKWYKGNEFTITLILESPSVEVTNWIVNL